jgi:tetratricopeptide (TPR) repeat protein
VGVREIGRRKAFVLATGAVGLAAALTAAAFVAPNKAAAAVRPYIPAHGSDVVATVPRRDPREAAERAALAQAPDRVELAVALARADISRARALSDPRYLGRAQATLSRWWTMTSPPADVLLLRATIEQSLHEFSAARADLDHLIAIRPADAQAQLTRAVVATVTADYPAARQSCDAVAALAPPIVAAACIAPLDALAGHAADAYDRLATAIDNAHDDPMALWATTTLAELAIQRGDEVRARMLLERVLAVDPSDAYTRAALADVLLQLHEPTAASALCKGYEQIDNLLVRRAIAEHAAHGPDAGALAQMMHDRIAAAAERGDRVHMREEAMFVLAVDSDATRALALAKANWDVQKELADARILAEAATAAGDRAAAAPVLDWASANGVIDARLEHFLGGLR